MLNQQADINADVRDFWVKTLTRIVGPVLQSGADGTLKSTMPIETKPGARDATLYTHLEAVGRTLAGVAPWLGSVGLVGEEESLRSHYAERAQKTITSIIDPDSSYYLNYSLGEQPLVDMAFLAQGLLRAPKVLIEPLATHDQQNLVSAFNSVRSHCKPYFSNWLLFAAMIEATLYRMGQPWDSMRVDYALRQHEQWYVGDGAYGDGPQFHWDYYNSFVIHPMLVDVLNTVGHLDPEWQRLRPIVMNRARRYAVVQERLIAPDGSYPPLGRSITYRFGAFHALAQMALLRQLPLELPPNQVRSAMTSVLRKFFTYPDMFDEDGWMRIGLYGHQPNLAEGYISTGSLYLFTVGFLPLGLPPEDDFWRGPSTAWTQKRLQLGEDDLPDHALE